jgi:GT2 family glycosyltransferase
MQRITVAICTMGRPLLLASALKTVSEQKQAPEQVVVVDNGIQEEVLRVVRDTIPYALYRAEPRQGLNIARNRALAETAGEILAYMDDDARADPGWLLSIAEGFERYPGAGAVTGLVLPQSVETMAERLFEANGGFGRGLDRRVLPHDSRTLFGRRLPAVVEAIGAGCGCNMAFKTSILKRIGGFDERLDTGPALPGGGDLDLFYRVLRSGWEIVYEPRAIVRHSHRRTMPELRDQLSGYSRALSAFLFKAFRTGKGGERIAAASFLAWRLAKGMYRLGSGAAGRDPLPFSILAGMFLASIVGLASYRARSGGCMS